MRVGFLHVDYLDKGYRLLAERMVRSVKTVMPELEIVQMTDTVTPDVAGVDDVLRMKPDNGDFMPYRLKHLSLFEGEAIFLDTDVIVREDLRDAFKEPFDVGLTRRDYPIFGRQTGTNLTERMPYNTGVMFSRSQEFFRDAYEACKELNEEERGWFGDQLSIFQIAKSGKYRVKDFNCEVWNRVPVTEFDYAQGKVIHYKGQKRKAWMLNPSKALA